MSVTASESICPLMTKRVLRQPHPWPAPSSRVLRGGSWNNNPQNLRSANRNRNTPTNRNNNNGFRVASTLIAGAAAFTDAAGAPRVRPEPAMMSGRRSGCGAVLLRRRLAGRMGPDGGGVRAREL
jgi:hypothetical protein